MSRPQGSASGERVRYFDRPTALNVLLFGVSLVLALVCEFGALTTLSSVELSCDRSAGTCTILTKGPLLGGAQVIPLARIHGAEVVVTNGKHRAYSVELVTDDGDVPLSHRLGNVRSEREAAKDAIVGFLHDPRALAVHVEYDESSPGGLLLVVLGPLWPIACSAVWQHTYVEIDRAAASLVIARTHWPHPTTFATYPVSAVRDVVVDEVPTREDKTKYAVALVLEGASDHRGINDATLDDPLRHELVAARIRTMLATYRSNAS